MKVLIFALFLASIPGFAHEGHDHDGPALVQAPKGGMIKSNEANHLEVIVKGKDIKIYVYSKDLKPVDVKTVKMTAETELPRTKKKAPLSLTAMGDHFAGTYDAKGAHRYTLRLVFGDHQDKFNFTVEPKK